jgi:periplasmic protein TonB
MSYQALLFCPDEKTARIVTQVLSELDFTVNPCTEPFAAVKKLMGERFDAVVVDCDNEQNATLLFKSARNAPNNQSALAVAVVEGQAGVAKAFRIGANLVLTKPINVEQAKGTLRVARGLLRKNEGAKPANHGTTTAAKPMTSAAAPAKPAAAIPNTRREAPIMPVAANIPAAKPAQMPIVVASARVETTEDSIDILEENGEQPAHASSSTIAERKSSSGFAASAPAPARESKPSTSIDDAVKTDVNENNSSIAATSMSGTSAPATEFTFGGTVKSGSEPAGGGGKKALLAVVAMMLVATGGYFAWTQWGHSNGTASAPAHVAAQPAPTPVPARVPQATPKPAPLSAPAAFDTQTTDTQATDTRTTASAAKAPAHPSKATAPSTSKPSPSAPKASKVPATRPDPEPMVIGNGHSKPARKSAATIDAPALSVTAVAPAGNAGALPNLMGESKAPTPVLEKLIVSQGVSRGLLVKQVQPVYPATALRMHTEGSVQMMATLSKNGDITDVKVLSGDRELARAAVDAVKKWKYKPYLLNGEPVDIQTQITVNFKLPR